MATPTLVQLLAEIDALLAARRPLVHATLRPGAAASELARLGKVPAPVAALFAWHDGQHDARALSPESNWFLHSIESALEAAAFLGNPEEEIQQPWRAEWLPVLDNGAGDHVVFDRTRGVLIEYRHDDEEREELHDDLAAWAEALRDQLGAVPLPAPLTPAQRWILACGGILTEMNDHDPTRLGGGEFPSKAEEMAGILRNAWGTRTTAEAIDVLERLRTVGHRARYEAAGKGPAATIGAWDLGRAVSVAGWAYGAGLLELEAAWAVAARAAMVAQAAFSSWTAFGDSYARGRAFWAADDDDPSPPEIDDEVQDTVRKLLAPGGAWHGLPWTTPLDGATAPEDGRPVVQVAPGELDDALENAPPNARLVLASGTYEGPFELTRHVEICSAPGAKVVLTSDDAPVVKVEEACVILRRLAVRATGDEGDAIHVESGRLVLDFVGVTATRHGVDLTSGAAEVQARNCRITDCGSGSILVESGYFAMEQCDVDGGKDIGVQIAGEADARIDRCKIHGAGGPGVAVAEQAKAVFSDCEIEGHAGHCVQVSDDASARFDRVDIHHGGAIGAAVYQQGGLILVDCKVRDHAGAGVSVSASDHVLLQTCHLARNGGSSLDLSEGAKVRGERLIIEGGADDGVCVDSSMVVLEQATVSGVAMCGVRVEEGGAYLTDVGVRGCGESGLFVAREGKATAQRCAITENTNNGVEIGERSIVALAQCKVAGNQGDGVFVYEGAKCKLDGGEVAGGGGLAVTVQEDGLLTIAGAQLTAGQGGLEQVESGGRIDRAPLTSRS